MNSKKSLYPSKSALDSAIKSSLGQQKADLVIKNGFFLDVFNGRFMKGDVAISAGKIIGVTESYEGEEVIDAENSYIVPGFIDAHAHIESSLMTPEQFQKTVLPHGTTTVIWDPHEITNVKGIKAIQWALDSTENLLLDIFIMLPSCVPAVSTSLNLDTNGATLSAKELAPFKNNPRILGLGELMNFKGILNGDDDMLTKLMEFKNYHLDGHCPKLSGKSLNAYVLAGIHNGHESTELEEAKEKLTKGLHVLIREGSCAKDADALLPALNPYTSRIIGLCSDDRNPADIEAEGHIDCIITKALKSGINPVDIFLSASFASAKMYELNDRGVIAPGYIADLCLVKPCDDNWKNGISVHAVYKNGVLIRPLELITEDLQVSLPVVKNKVQLDLPQDILKISVFERHKNTGSHSVGFVKGFALKQGAIATSINHDSHNVIAIGTSNEAISKAVNRLLTIDGGIVVLGKEEQFEELPLPIGGLMTDIEPKEISKKLTVLKKAAQNIGCVLEEPFLQLAFLALPVIPYLKITNLGLVDVEKLKIIPVCYD